MDIQETHMVGSINEKTRREPWVNIEGKDFGVVVIDRGLLPKCLWENAGETYKIKITVEAEKVEE